MSKNFDDFTPPEIGTILEQAPDKGVRIAAVETYAGPIYWMYRELQVNGFEHGKSEVFRWYLLNIDNYKKFKRISLPDDIIRELNKGASIIAAMDEGIGVLRKNLRYFWLQGYGRMDGNDESFNRFGIGLGSVFNHCSYMITRLTVPDWKEETQWSVRADMYNAETMSSDFTMKHTGVIHYLVLKRDLVTPVTEKAMIEDLKKISFINVLIQKKKVFFNDVEIDYSELNEIPMEQIHNLDKEELYARKDSKISGVIFVNPVRQPYFPPKGRCYFFKKGNFVLDERNNTDNVIGFVNEDVMDKTNAQKSDIVDFRKTGFYQKTCEYCKKLIPETKELENLAPFFSDLLNRVNGGPLGKEGLKRSARKYLFTKKGKEEMQPIETKEGNPSNSGGKKNYTIRNIDDSEMPFMSFFDTDPLTLCLNMGKEQETMFPRYKHLIDRLLVGKCDKDDEQFWLGMVVRASDIFTIKQEVSHDDYKKFIDFKYKHDRNIDIQWEKGLKKSPIDEE